MRIESVKTLYNIKIGRCWA